MSNSCLADFLELSRHLKQERLYVVSEREHLITLHGCISLNAEKLYHTAWITRQQKSALVNLILGSDDAMPASCCQQVNNLESFPIADGYRRLTYHEAKIGRFLRLMRDMPKLVASCLVHAETSPGYNSEMMHRIACVIISGLYGNVVMPEDETNVLLLLKHLIDIQVSRSEDPSRLLRRGSCAFSTVFRLLTESIFSSRIFLTAALHHPVMQLLMEDEWFYDIDADRALHRFPPNESLRRFGAPGSREYEQSTRVYREQIVNKLVTLVNHFISNIQASMYCFPSSLAWIVSQLYQSLTKGQAAHVAMARAICADLVLASFICPAVCDPEPLGITSDAPISYIARHNLMQVGQILQVLTVSSSDDVDQKSKDLYSKFPKGCMSFVLDTLLDATFSASPPSSNFSVSGFCRSSMLLSCAELLELTSFVHRVIETTGEDVPEHKQLEELLCTSGLPPLSVIQTMCLTTQCASVHSGSLHVSPNTTPQATPPGTPNSSRRLPRLQQQTKEKKRFLLTAPGVDGHVDNGGESDASANNVVDELLVISLGVVSECPGMLPEQKVLEQEAVAQGRQKKVKYDSLLPGEDDPVSERDILAHEKRTRFSLSHDQDSIATSDNIEAISEAASSHSVGSDLDNENDNLSDMVSANVSGHGTPNVSGRDTPISQADSQVEAGAEPEVEEQPRAVVPNLPVTVQKTNRVDVTDRFGKFEIRQELERDDIKSVVSDTWSTDVIASDSEPPEQNQLERLEEVVEEPAANLLGVHEALESSEIASDAWSTDVLASDTSERQSERLLELDQDDLASVSGRSVGIGSEAGELVELVAEEVSQASGKQSPRSPTFRNSTGGAEASLSSSSLSPHRRIVPLKDPSEITLHQQDPDLEASSLLLAAGDTADSGGFQMDRYIHDSGDSSRTRHEEVLVVSEVVVVDNSVLQAFDPLGYAQIERKHSRDSEYDDNVDSSVGMKAASSDICLSCRPPDPIAGGDLLGSSWLSGSAGSLVDLGVESRGPPLPTTCGSLVSVDTLTAKDGASNENIKSDRRYDDKAPELLVAVGSSSGVWTKNVDSARNTQVSVIQPTESGTRLRPALVVSNGKGHDVLVKSSDSCELDGEDVHGPTANSSATHRIAGKPSSVVVTAPVGTLQDGTKDDDDKKVVDKRKTGLFHVFRERLSKGAFPVTGQSAKGGKRKTTTNKFFDRDEVFRASADLDKADSHSLSGVRVVLTQGSDASDESTPKTRSSLNGSGHANKADESTAAVDTTEDILAKYRKPAAAPLKPGIGTAVQEDGGCSSKEKERLEEDDRTPLYDSNNLESCKAFLDAKKKLRLILSHIDLQLTSTSHSVSSASAGGGDRSQNGANVETKETDLVLQLRAQLAEAINLQDGDLVAQLHETIRCLRQFNNHEIKKLLRTMRDEYRSRSSYIAYLARCRQGLLSSLAFIDRLVVRVNRDKTMVNKHLLTVLVRLFLEKHESMILKFVSDFAKLTVSDEKADLVENFLSRLHRHMETDGMWQAASVAQLEEAKLYIERSVMSRIYTQAMFPNGDADMMRDQILQEHMLKLAKVITPFHKDLRIPKGYRYECPWPAAQTHIYMINVYKTPKDKLQCVLRCSSTIMNLLSMASDRSVPAADDFMPVLIFVLIKSGTTQLLSNVQFVREFYEKRLTGEEQYWWMQFVSAIEFIKTMDYGE